MDQRISTIVQPPGIINNTLESQSANIFSTSPHWDVKSENTIRFIQKRLSFPPDDAGPSSSSSSGLDATPRPILTELHLDCDRYYPKQLRLAETRLEEAAALQAPTWRKLEKHGATLTDAERQLIFDRPDFAMILWKHRRRHDLAHLVATLPVDSLFHTTDVKSAQEWQMYLTQKQGKVLQHRLLLQQQRLQLQKEQEQLSVVEETVTRTGGLKRPSKRPRDNPEAATAIAAAAPPQEQPAIDKEQQLAGQATADSKETGIPTSKVLDAATPEAPEAADCMQQEFILAYIKKEDQRIERERKEALHFQRMKERKAPRQNRKALAREKPVVLQRAAAAAAAAADTPVPAAAAADASVPAAATAALPTIAAHPSTSNTQAKAGPKKKPSLVLTPVDRTTERKTSAEKQNARSQIGETKRIFVVRKADGSLEQKQQQGVNKNGHIIVVPNRSVEATNAGPVMGPWRRNPATKNSPQPLLIEESTITEESPRNTSASQSDLEELHQYVAVPAFAAAAAAAAAAVPAVAAPAAVAANAEAFSLDHDYSPEFCVWPLADPDRVRTPIYIPISPDPSSNAPRITAPRTKPTRPPRALKMTKVVVAPQLVPGHAATIPTRCETPRDPSLRDPPTFRNPSNNPRSNKKGPARKSDKVVEAPAPAQRQKTKLADHFPGSGMHDSVITQPTAPRADAVLAKVLPKQSKKKEVRPAVPPKKKKEKKHTPTTQRTVGEPKKRKVEDSKNQKVGQPKKRKYEDPTEPDSEEEISIDVLLERIFPLTDIEAYRNSFPPPSRSEDSAFVDMSDTEYEQMVSEVSEEEFNAEFARFNNMEMNLSNHC